MVSGSRFSVEYRESISLQNTEHFANISKTALALLRPPKYATDIWKIMKKLAKTEKDWKILIFVYA